MPTSQSQSFLALPREIRDLVYNSCSLSHENHGNWMTARNFRKQPESLGSVALFGTCKQVHAEAAAIFYGNRMHIFAMGWNGKYYDNTSCIASRYLRMVKSCVLFVDPYTWHSGSAVRAKRHVFLKVQAMVEVSSFTIIYHLSDLRCSLKHNMCEIFAEKSTLIRR